VPLRSRGRGTTGGFPRERRGLWGAEWLRPGPRPDDILLAFLAMMTGRSAMLAPRHTVVSTTGERWTHIGLLGQPPAPRVTLAGSVLWAPLSLGRADRGELSLGGAGRILIHRGHLDHRQLSWPSRSPSGRQQRRLISTACRTTTPFPLSTFGHGLPNQTTGHGLREHESKGRSQDTS
jgi:hypothetical protein